MGWRAAMTDYEIYEFQCIFTHWPDLYRPKMGLMSGSLAVYLCSSVAEISAQVCGLSNNNLSVSTNFTPIEYKAWTRGKAIYLNAVFHCNKPSDRLLKTSVSLIIPPLSCVLSFISTIFMFHEEIYGSMFVIQNDYANIFVITDCIELYRNSPAASRL